MKKYVIKERNSKRFWVCDNLYDSLLAMATIIAESKDFASDLRERVSDFDTENSPKNIKMFKFWKEAHKDKILILGIVK
jgi:hypothetical protein